MTEARATPHESGAVPIDSSEAHQGLPETAEHALGLPIENMNIFDTSSPSSSSPPLCYSSSSDNVFEFDAKFAEQTEPVRIHLKSADSVPCAGGDREDSRAKHASIIENKCIATQSPPVTEIPMFDSSSEGDMVCLSDLGSDDDLDQAEHAKQPLRLFLTNRDDDDGDDDFTQTSHVSFKESANGKNDTAVATSLKRRPLTQKIKSIHKEVQALTDMKVRHHKVITHLVDEDQASTTTKVYSRVPWIAQVDLLYGYPALSPTISSITRKGEPFPNFEQLVSKAFNTERVLLKDLVLRMSDLLKQCEYQKSPRDDFILVRDFGYPIYELVHWVRGSSFTDVHFRYESRYKKAVALYTYKAVDIMELSVQQGDMLFALDRAQEGWILVSICSQPHSVGFVPEKYVKLNEDADP